MCHHCARAAAESMQQLLDMQSCTAHLCELDLALKLVLKQNNTHFNDTGSTYKHSEHALKV